MQSFTNKKHYLHATKVLTSAILLGNGRLRDVEGLNDLRNDLNARRDQLYTKLIEELNKHLYQVSTSDTISSFQRIGSSTRNGSANYISPFQRNNIRRSTERAEANSKVRRALFEMSQGFDVDKTEIIDDPELLDTDLNTSYFVGIIVECFALLRKVPESLDTIRLQIQPELLTIVQRTTQHMLTIMATDVTSNTNTNDESIHPLLDLIDLIYKQFKLIAAAHQLLLKNYSSVLQRHAIIAAKPYDIADYWTQAQTVLQLLLTDYLDIQNVANEESPATSFAEQNSSINSFFNRRKVQTYVLQSQIKFNSLLFVSLLDFYICQQKDSIQIR